MTKNIVITNVDGMNLADKHNMNTPSQKKKAVHEQLFEQYGIDPVKVFEQTGILKMIPPEWIFDILVLNLQNCKTPRIYENINKTEKSINIGFRSSEEREKFEEEFNLNMPKSINSFITSQNDDPKKYNRIIVIETAADGQQLTFRY